jgi:hypothetical protein
MLGIPLRYLLRHPLTIVDLAAHPLELGTKIVDRYVAEREQRRPDCIYNSDEDWDKRLHEHLGMKWPCELASEFWSLWPLVMEELKAKGIQAGPESFGSWNDGDAGLARATWCLTRHLRPENVVETGVAHGVTSRFILEALERNGRGHLSSVDLAPVEKDWQAQVGAAVGERQRRRWTYIEGPSRLRLPKLLARIGEIDLFIHDSLHSERNVRFELDRAWAALRPGGALVVDDVDANWGFRSFTQTFSGHQFLTCEAEPLRPDLRRFNKKGLFGIILKEPTAMRMAA